MNMHILGLSVYSKSKSDFLKTISHFLKSKRHGYICVTSAHGIVESLLHKDIWLLHKNATYIVPDGMPLVWLGKLLQYSDMERIYGPDLFWDINRLCEKERKSVFLYGASTSTLRKLNQVLSRLFPRLRIVGSYSPPFRPLSAKEHKAIACVINKMKPDIVWVGLSTPKQELWMSSMQTYVQSSLLIGVGAAFDFAAGIKKQAPTWMRTRGIEWLFRLGQEPKRLFFRYIKNLLVFPFIALFTLVTQHIARLWKKKYGKSIAIAFACVFLAGIVCIAVPKYNWTTFASYGGIYGNILVHKDTLVFGTQYSKMYAINKNTGKKLWETTLDFGFIFEHVIQGEQVIAASGDSLYAMDIHNGKILWKTSQEHQYDFVNIKVYESMLFTGDKEGTLTAYRLSDGKMVWRHEVKPPETLSSIESDGFPDYFGNYIVAQNIIYFGSRDGSLSAIDPRTGKIVWSYLADSAITSGPYVFSDVLTIGTKSGHLYAFHPKTGKILWEKNTASSLRCLSVDYRYTMFYEHIVGRFLRFIISAFHLSSYVYASSVLSIYEDGAIILTDLKTGKEIWKTKVLHPKLTCPSIWYSRIFIGSADGSISAISSVNGSSLWTFMGNGSLTNPPVLAFEKRWYMPHAIRPMLPPRVVSTYLSGDMYVLSGKNGSVIWNHQFVFPPQTVLIDGGYVYIGQSDGTVNKLSFYSGVYGKPKDLTISALTTEMKKVGNNVIMEMTIHTPEYIYTNPWQNVVFEVLFTHESGKQVHVYGFYFDKDTWKIRFNPPMKGRWTWNLTMSAFGYDIKRNGFFTSQTDTKESFLRTNSINKRRLTLDQTHIFNLIGIGDGFMDENYSGTPLDDWAMGNSSPFTATSSGGLTHYFKSNQIISLKNYLETYAKNGTVFNVFRISLMNNSIGLWNTFDFAPDYSLHNGKILDRFMEDLRNNNMHVWLTMFAFGIPNAERMSRADEILLRSYVRYIIDRYGAYVDIWELANEFFVEKYFLDILVDEIHQRDFEHRPISTSFEQPESEHIDIISPHWYETEPLYQSDLRMREEINKFIGYEKPIVYGEQGNGEQNYDAFSASRMRVRIWTAFFEGASLIFWNQTDRKDYHSDVFHNGNLYIGEEERSYVRIFQDITKLIPLDAKEKDFSVDTFSVRKYGLEYKEGATGYFVHGSGLPSSFGMHVDRSSRIQWIDPVTGTMLKEDLCMGLCDIRSPIFHTDIAVKMIYVE